MHKEMHRYVDPITESFRALFVLCVCVCEWPRPSVPVTSLCFGIEVPVPSVYTIHGLNFSVRILFKSGLTHVRDISWPEG